MCSIIVHTVSCCQKPGFAFADHTHVGMFGARGAAIQVIHARVDSKTIQLVKLVSSAVE